jgi:hypothetical protein
MSLISFLHVAEEELEEHQEEASSPSNEDKKMTMAKKNMRERMHMCWRLLLLLLFKQKRYEVSAS